MAFRLSDAACSSCHRAIDPAGAAFEVFDEAGQPRESYEDGESVYYTHEFYGETVEGPEDLTTIVLEGRFTSCMSSQILGWASFQRLSLGVIEERCAAQGLVAELGEAPGLRDLFASAFTTNTFRFRLADKAGQ